MGWNRERNKTDHALMRIVALLLALACLAERVGSLPRPVRSRALWFLRPAEAVAWEFVTGQVHPAIPCSYRRDEAAEAMRLALGFRALARSLEAQALPPRRFPFGWPERAERSRLRWPCAPACETPKLDTS